MIQLLTTTGFRPEAFELCRFFMERQTYTGDVRWIIVHDDDPYEYTGVRPGARWQVTKVDCSDIYKTGLNTQKRNLGIGLRSVNRNLPLLIIDYDDWYPPHWLDLCVQGLKAGADLFGQTRMRKYHLTQRIARQRSFPGRSCLCATAMKGNAIDVFFNTVVNPSIRLPDVALWATAGLAKAQAPGNHVVGLKGLPGRSGIDSLSQFDSRFSKLQDGDVIDHDGSILRDWIGDDTRLYSQWWLT